MREPWVRVAGPSITAVVAFVAVAMFVGALSFKVLKPLLRPVWWARYWLLLGIGGTAAVSRIAVDGNPAVWGPTFWGLLGWGMIVAGGLLLVLVAFRFLREDGQVHAGLEEYRAGVLGR